MLDGLRPHSESSEAPPLPSSMETTADCRRCLLALQAPSTCSSVNPMSLYATTNLYILHRAH
jgi:hypothetical protein